MNKRILVAATAALVACGGGSSWSDPTTGNFSAQDTADVMGMVSSGFSAAVMRQAEPQMPIRPGASGAALTQTVNVTQSCVPTGQVSVVGSMDASCSVSGDCSFSGGLKLTLAACASPNGLVGDGYLDIGASGSSSSTASSSSFSLHETVQGGITVTRNGTTIGTCGINVTVDVSETLTGSVSSSTVHVSGTICRQPIAQ